MRRKNKTPAKSSTKKKVVVSAAAAYDYDDDYENLSPYCEPVRMYHTLHVRSICNPSFLRRSVNYNIADKRKKKSGVNKRILFDYLHCRNKTLQLTEFTETCTCPFCSMQCVTFKVLELHLNTSHDLFEYHFKFLKAYVKVGVYVKDGHNHKRLITIMCFAAQKLELDDVATRTVWIIIRPVTVTAVKTNK
ncbi:unnamed protein product [Cochlearia groenlandica]